MYVTNIQHFMDEDGNIPTGMPKEATELANYFALLIDDATSGDYDADPTIRCIEKGCQGMVLPFIFDETDEICWICPICKTEGVISNWRGTKWDNGNG
jgi:hypothetical protein